MHGSTFMSNFACDFAKQTTITLMYKQETIKPYSTDGSKREQVEAMFDNIAPTYDFLNHLLSFGIDKVWRRMAIDYLRPFSPRTILDIATGTGDFAILANEKLGPDSIVGCDISEGMMDVARAKVGKRGLDKRISFQYEDCAQMSFADNRFDAVISAFALRNFQHLDESLREMHRVMAEGGHLSVIDLCTPVSFPMAQFFYIYKKVVMPLIGRLFSKDGSAYSYLPATMDAVPQAERMTEIITRAGFRNARYRRLPFGMCILYTAEK